MGSRGGDTFREAVLVHYPVGLLALGSFAAVEDERLLDAHFGVAVGHVNRLVRPCGFPVAARCGSVGPGAIGVLPIPRREEVPFPLPEQRLVFSSVRHHYSMSVKLSLQRKN